MSTKKVFTLADLRNCYVSLRRVWEPFARKAIDDLMRGIETCGACGADADLIGDVTRKWDKIELTNKAHRASKRAYVRCSKCGWQEVADRNTKQMIHDYLWEQDSGFTTFDDAIDALAKAKGATADKERDWVGESSGHFSMAWNKEQNRYMKQHYGLGKEVTNDD